MEYANFDGAGLTLAELYSTASYVNGSLSGVGLANTDLTGADLAGKNLNGETFPRPFSAEPI